MQPWIDFKDEIEAVVIEYGVTNVSAGAFESCSNLKSVTLAASVGRIDDYAFFLCPRLETVTIVPGDLYVIGKHSFQDRKRQYFR